MVLRDRLLKLQMNLEPHQACLLASPFDISYFTGCTPLLPEEREALLIVTGTYSQTEPFAYVLLGGFSPFQSEKEAHSALSLSVLTGVSPFRLTGHLEQIVKTHTLTELLIDKDVITVSEAEALAKVTGLEIKSLPRQWVWRLRGIKDTEEQNNLRKAGKIAAQVSEQIASWLRPGLTEKKLSELIQNELKKLGSEKEAFPTIVAFGAHTALPHHQPTDTSLTPETAVLVDFGATVQGYRSDMTRMFWFGEKPDPEFLKQEQVVKEAYQGVLQNLKQKKTVTAADLDDVAREYITDQGYGSLFIHTTGHGVGLDIHEFPSLNAQEHTSIESGMVITIEPGVYVVDKFGYRFENTVLITDAGAEILTEANTEN